MIQQTTSDVAIVLTTFGAGDAALRVAQALVQERLAACVNVLPVMTSVYRWQGAVHEDGEQQVVIKTTRDRLPQLEARLRQLHPYELPEFLVLATEGGAEAYLAWVGAAVAPAGPDGPGGGGA